MRFVKFLQRPFLAVLASLAVLMAVSPAPQVAGDHYVPTTSFAQTLEHNALGNFAAIISPQAAEAAAMSNYFQNKFLDWFLRAQTFTPPATVYVALATTTGSAAACGTEVTGGSYARVAVTSSTTNWAGTQSAGSTAASSGTSGQTSNNASITFPSPTANWGTVTSFCVFDASTGGNLLLFSALTVSKTINNGDAAPSFAAAALTYTITKEMELEHPQFINPDFFPNGLGGNTPVVMENVDRLNREIANDDHFYDPHYAPLDFKSAVGAQ